MAQRQLYSGLDLYDWRGTGPNGRTKAVDVDKWQQNQEDIRHLPGAFPVQSVVITDGQITPTVAALSVDTEGGAPADDLTAIAPGDLHAGMLLALCSVDTGRKVTIKNSAGASGIQTLDGKDVVLDTQYAVMLRLVSTESLTLWREEPGPLRLQLTVSTPDKLGGVKVQTGDDDGLEMIGDKLRVRNANSTQRGSVLASETAAANAVPQAGEDGRLDASWLLSGLPIGYIYAWPYSTPMDGSIQINGQLLNRQLYADLFAYAQSHGQVITEAEWQEKAAQQGGYCAFYSEGDGSTTFRAPKFAPYQKFTMVSSDAGKYYEAGLPGITGDVDAGYGGNSQWLGLFNSGSGCFKTSGNYNQRYASVLSGGENYTGMSFDASGSDKIYGNSDTVRPESMDWIVCVVAFGTVTNVGSVDVANVMAAVGQVQVAVETAQKTADAAVEAGGKVVSKGSRSTAGDWTISGLTIGKLLYIVMDSTATNTYLASVDIRTISGAIGGTGGQGNYLLGRQDGGSGPLTISPPTFIVVPTSTTVVLNLYDPRNCKLTAFQ